MWSPMRQITDGSNSRGCSRKVLQDWWRQTVARWGPTSPTTPKGWLTRRTRRRARWARSLASVLTTTCCPSSACCWRRSRGWSGWRSPPSWPPTCCELSADSCQASPRTGQTASRFPEREGCDEGAGGIKSHFLPGCASPSGRSTGWCGSCGTRSPPPSASS